MFAPCLVLLLGGALPGAGSGVPGSGLPGTDPSDVRIFHAVVVRPAEEAEAELPDEAEDTRAAPAEAGPVLRKAEVRPTPEPAKEH